MKPALILVASGLTATTLLLTGCSTQPTRPQYQPEPLDELGQAHDRFVSKMQIVINDERNTPKQGEYIEAGLAYSDLACRFWFETLGKHGQETEFAKNILNIVGNLILGIGGINGTSPNSLARGSLLLGAANASFDSYRDAFLKATVGPIQEKVWEKRKVIKADVVAAKANLRGFDHARTLLLEYHRVCAPDAIETIVRENFEKLEYKSADTTLSSVLATSEMERLSRDLYQSLLKNNGLLGPDDVFKLWLRLTKEQPSDPRSDQYKKLSAGPYTDLLARNYEGNSTLAPTVLPKLQRFADLSGFIDLLERKVRDLQIEQRSAELIDAGKQVGEAEKLVLGSEFADKVVTVLDPTVKSALNAIVEFAKQPTRLSEHAKGIEFVAKLSPPPPGLDPAITDIVNKYGSALAGYKNLTLEVEKLRATTQTTEIKKPVVQSKSAAAL